MRKPPALSFDAIFTALAVLGAGAGCSKAERAVAEPPAAAPAASETPAEPAAAAPSPSSPAPPPAPETAALDAGAETIPATKPKERKAGGSANCGATGCSADMRKGGK